LLTDCTGGRKWPNEQALGFDQRPTDDRANGRQEGHDQSNAVQQTAYSITSSAMASSVGGTVRPSALAVLRLNHQLELGWRLHGKISWLFALEDAVDIAGCAPALVDDISSV
jgi:hypothetical protein